MNKILIIALCIGINIGCTSVKRYDGPPRPAHEIAILEKEDSTYGGISVVKINGKFRGIGTSDRYEFLPGTVSIKVNYTDARSGEIVSGRSIELTFGAEEGEVYSLKYKLMAGSWIAWVEEKKTGVTVSEIND